MVPYAKEPEVEDELCQRRMSRHVLRVTSSATKNATDTGVSVLTAQPEAAVPDRTSYLSPSPKIEPTSLSSITSPLA
jgi:hypothetical protein